MFGIGEGRAITCFINAGMDVSCSLVYRNGGTDSRAPPEAGGTSRFCCNLFVAVGAVSHDCQRGGAEVLKTGVRM